MRWLNLRHKTRGTDPSGSDRALSRSQPTVELLEARVALSAAVPANTLGVVQGDVTTPGRGADVATSIAAGHLTDGRSSTLIGLLVQPESGGLRPRITAVEGPDGASLPLTQQTRSRYGSSGSLVTFVRAAQPGTLTIHVTGSHGTTGAFQLSTFLPGDVNGDGQVNLTDLQGLSRDYLAKMGQKRYDPAADANLNGQVGMSDALALQRNLPPLGPHVPIFLELSVVPSENVPHPNTYNSGAIVNQSKVVIRGRTAPGSLVFVDNTYGTYSFNRELVPTDAHGNFTHTEDLGNKNFTAALSFLVIDPSGRQLIRNYPIRVV